jgi:hypothetical protein
MGEAPRARRTFAEKVLINTVLVGMVAEDFWRF